MKDIIEIKNLYKSYNKKLAVKDLSIKVKESELYAFLGVNGAGKSTTINIMCNELKKDSGQVIIDGHDIEKEADLIKKEIGVVFQSSSLDKKLSVYDNLKSRAALYDIKGKEFTDRLNEISEILDFKDYLKKPLEKLSGGQKRRIDIARALFHHPKILILDEPTTGLDPMTRKLIWEVIDSLRKKEKLTVFLTTHYMEEASEADYVTIIDEGKIIAEGTPLDLKNKYVGDYVLLYNVNEEEVKKLNLEYTPIRDGFKVQVENIEKAKNLIINNPSIFVDFEVIKGKMDDVFLSVTGKRLGER